MNENLSRLLNAIGAQLPALAALIPVAGALKVGVGVVAAIGQAMLGNPNATPEQMANQIEDDPERAKAALQPLEDHAKAVAGAAVEAVATTPTDQIPAVTAAMENSVAFATDDRPFMLSQVDADGGAILSMYMDAKELESLRESTKG